MAKPRTAAKSNASAHYITIAGDAVAYERGNLKLSKIQLDVNNPRIRHAGRKRARGRQLTSGELRELIQEDPGFSELFKAIRDNSGLLEPICVHANGCVIEGNCRAAAYLKLAESDPSDARWREIPAHVFRTITPVQVAILQGSMHVRGKNPWRAYEKAGHVYSMHKELSLDAKEIATSLGMQARVVQRLLEAYATMTEKVLPRLKGSRALEKWSYVEEFYKNTKLADYRKDDANVDEFVGLVVEGKLARGTDVRELPAVLKNTRAAKALREHGMERALAVLAQADPTVNSAILKQVKKLCVNLSHMEASEIERIRDQPNAQSLFQELNKAVKEVAATAKFRL